jgi:TIR domain-containing protein
MRCFICYAREDEKEAERISVRLEADGHRCFFDKASVPTGGAYDGIIREQIQKAHVFIFLISQHSVKGGRYTITELKLAQEKWPRPRGRVVPVLIDDTPHDSMPPYLAALNVLSPAGNRAAEVASEIDKLRRSRRAHLTVATVVTTVLAAAVIAGTNAAVRRSGQQGLHPATQDTPPVETLKADVVVSNANPPPAPPGRSPVVTRPTPAVVVERKHSNGHATASPERDIKPVALPAKEMPRLRFFAQALMVPELADELVKIDGLAHEGRWEAAADALSDLSAGHLEPRLWLAAAHIHAKWNYPTYRSQAEVEIGRAQRSSLSKEVAQVARSIRNMLDDPR